MGLWVRKTKLTAFDFPCTLIPHTCSRNTNQKHLHLLLLGCLCALCARRPCVYSPSILPSYLIAARQWPRVSSDPLGMHMESFCDTVMLTLFPKLTTQEKREKKTFPVQINVPEQQRSVSPEILDRAGGRWGLLDLLLFICIESFHMPASPLLWASTESILLLLAEDTTQNRLENTHLILLDFADWPNVLGEYILVFRAAGCFRWDETRVVLGRS